MQTENSNVEEKKADVMDDPTKLISSYDYVRQATRTESPAAEETPISEIKIEALLMMGRELVMLGNLFNGIKRSVFYNKNDPDPVPAIANAFPSWYAAMCSLDSPPLGNRLLTRKQLRLLHGLIGKTTELAELWESLGVSLLTEQPIDEVNLVEELGDGFWYDAILIDTVGAQFNDVLQVNINKLKARYGDKFTQKSALIRNLGIEREILEHGTGVPVAAMNPPVAL